MNDNALFFLENPEVAESLREESGVADEALRFESYRLEKYYVSPGKMIFGLKAATVMDLSMPRVILACPATLVEDEKGLLVAMPLTSGNFISLYPGQIIFSSADTSEHGVVYNRMLSARPQEVLQKCLPHAILQALHERSRELLSQVTRPKDLEASPGYLQLELDLKPPTHAATLTRQ